MSWRTCPFEVGKKYFVILVVVFLNHHLVKGAEVVYKDQSYDFHAGLTRFWFSNADGSETNAWHVFDSDPDPSVTWKSYFQQI